MSKLVGFDLPAFRALEKCGDCYLFVCHVGEGGCHWSANAVEIFPVSEESESDIGGWESVVSQEDLPGFMENFSRLQKGEQGIFFGNYRFMTRAGDTVWVHVKVSAVNADNEGGRCLAGVIKDVEYCDNCDPVTGLKSNYAFRSALSLLKASDISGGILIMGIDQFKQINDLYSYTFGDQVLRCVSVKLQQGQPEGSVLYRLDGDQFGLIYPGATREGAARCFEEFQGLLREPLLVDREKVSLTVTGAVCAYPEDGEDGDELYRNLRLTLHEAKKRNRGRHMLFSPESSGRTQRQMRLFKCLKESVADGYAGFSLNYQPLILAEDGSLCGCEALLRWKHPEFSEDVTPTEFVPVLEHSGLILDVGRWVVDTAFRQCARWAEHMSGFRMNVNVSCNQFEDSDFKFYVMDKINHYGLNPGSITLELTESGKIMDTAIVQLAFDFLRSQGVQIAFDDFGTGNTSLSIFRSLSVDELKIDRCFVRELSYNVLDQTVISHLISLCKSMNMEVCVEGIETDEVDRTIRQLNPQLLQGFYYNRPLTADSFEEYYFSGEATDTGSSRRLVRRAGHAGPAMAYADNRPMQPLSPMELLDEAYAGIFQVALDPDFTFLTCNQGYRRMLGYTAQQMEEKFQNRALGIVYKDDIERVNQEIRRQLGMGDTVLIEFRVVRADGSPIWIIGSGNVVKERNGIATLVVVILENDKNKKQILENSTRLGLLEETLLKIPTGVNCVRLDPDLTLEYISPGFLSILGYSQEDLGDKLGGRFVDLIYKDDVKRIDSDIRKQHARGDVLTLKYRVVQKDGRLVWLETVSRVSSPGADGVMRLYSTVVDLSESKSKADSARDEEIAERLQTASKQWGEVLFEFYVSDESLRFSDNFFAMFGRAPKRKVSEELENIYEEDRTVLLEALRLSQEGKQVDPVEVRVRGGEGNYIWCSVFFNLPGGRVSSSATVLGKICNIDREKRKRDQLLERSRRDSLTGLYNKGALEEKISEVLESANCGQTGALFMVDVDNFKWVNDNLGHPFGDQVLREIANRLHRAFRPEDIVGRAGGDEFMAFILCEPSVLAKKGEQILCAMRPAMCYQGVTYQISISIGISCYPKDGTQFYDLFRHADKAMYRAKARGKNNCCIYAK